MSEMAVEPVAPAEPAEPAAEPAEPAAVGLDLDAPEVQERIAALADQRLEQRLAQFAEPTEPQQPTLDPFADDFADQLGSFLEQKLSPITQRFEHQAITESEARAMDIIADIESREGEFLVPDESRKLARKLADEFMPAATQRFGLTPKAAEAALSEAYKAVKALEDQIGKAYYDRQVNQIRGLAGAPRDTPAGQVGSQELVAGGYRDGRSVAQRYFGR